MAIPTLYAPQYFTGNNSTSTAYVCSWKGLDVANLRVVATDSLGVESSALSNGSGITVTLVGNTVEFTTTTAYDSTYTLTAFLTSDFLQSVDLQVSGSADPNVREEMFDKLTLMMQIALQDVSETAGLPITFPVSEEATTQTLPTAPNRQNSMIEFDDSGDLTTITKLALFQQIENYLTAGTVDDVIANLVVNLSANRTLAQADFFRLWMVDTSSGDITITLPQDSDATINVASKVDFSNEGANDILFVAGAGATLQSASGTAPKVGDTYGGATVVKTAADTWRVYGRITAS